MSQFSFLRFKKLRFYFAWPFATFIALTAKTTALGFWLGIPVIVSGEALRVWSQGHIEKRTRLANSGPYAYVRNPLYLSNYLIGLGFVLIFSNLWILLIYSIGFFILYQGTIREEENFLLGEYQDSYQDYFKRVPRFFPTLEAYPNRSNQNFTWQLVWRHGEHVTFLTILLLVISLYLRQEWYQKGSGFYSNHLFLFWFGMLILILLVASALHRKFK